jgi:structural maintenance of chromosome 2
MIEGFKSYSHPVIISDLDPQFNSITGMNGSGKSNILDSICFVLGINHSQVRVTNLQELVYKQGQSGITKASVSITFDNHDKDNGKCPFGFEAFNEIIVSRQIVINGRNKYQINGKNVEFSQVKSFFQSVQLNINNPHFLIMQGKVSKVLNSKPSEIMKLLEETVGTRIYDIKKEHAKKTMEKTAIKIMEIQNLVKKEIIPVLKIFKENKKDYFTWKKLAQETTSLREYLALYEFITLENALSESRFKNKCKKKIIKEFDRILEITTKAVYNEETEIEKIQSEIINEYNSKIKILQSDISLRRKKLTSYISRYNSLSSDIFSKQFYLKILENYCINIKIIKTEIYNYKTCIEFIRSKEECKSLNYIIQEIEKSFEIMEKYRKKNGIISQELLEKSLIHKYEIESQMNSIEVSKYYIKNILDKLDEYLIPINEDIAFLKQRSKKKSQSDLGCENCNLLSKFNNIDLSKIKSEERRVSKEVNKMKTKIHEIWSLTKIKELKDGEIEHKKSIFGVAVSLFWVKDLSMITALETIAGGKLLNFVVATEIVAKSLLANRHFKQRVTFIPLNKIDNMLCSTLVVNKVRKFFQGRSNLAVDQIGFCDDVKNAMRYIFGKVFICYDALIAKKIAFGLEVHNRAVTLVGDDFNPRGFLTGGSRNKGNFLLSKLREIESYQIKLQYCNKILTRIEACLKKLSYSSEEAKHQRRKLILNELSIFITEKLFEKNIAQDYYVKLECLLAKIIHFADLVFEKQSILTKQLEITKNYNLKRNQKYYIWHKKKYPL